MGKQRKSGGKKPAANGVGQKWTPDQLVLSKLKAAYLASNIGQQKLSEKAGISQSRLSKIFSGDGRPFADQMAAIAKHLNISMDWLMDEDRPGEYKPELSEDEQKLIFAFRSSSMPASEAVAAMFDRQAGKSGAPKRTHGGD